MLARAEGDVDFNIFVELAENRNHPVKREAAKLGITDAGEFRVRNARQFLGVAGRKLALIEDVDDLCCDNGARLFKPRVGPSKVAVDVAASLTSISSERRGSPKYPRRS